MVLIRCRSTWPCYRSPRPTLEAARSRQSSSIIGTLLTSISNNRHAFFQNLMQVDLKTTSNANCAKANNISSVPSAILCAAGKGKDTCNGDSGVPLVAKRGTKWIQVGLSTAGDGCARPGLFSYYARISELETIMWIRSVIATTPPILAPGPFRMRLQPPAVPARAGATAPTLASVIRCFGAGKVCRSITNGGGTGFKGVAEAPTLEQANRLPCNDAPAERTQHSCVSR